MSEINNSDMLKRFKSVAKAAAPKASETPVQKDKIEDLNNEKSFKDLGNIPAEAIGRSQVSKADNLVNDMKIMRENPKLVLHADEFFDYTLKQFTKEGRADAYEQACLATAGFINEFSKKPQI